MKTTGHFRFRMEQRARASGLTKEIAQWVVRNAERKYVQPNGRIQFDAFVPELNREIRVVLLKDRETFHTIFPIYNMMEEDRNEN